MENGLQEFITANREEIITRCRAKQANRSTPRPTAGEIHYGVPLFLGQLIEELGRASQTAEIVAGANAHGRALRDRGFAISQVVHYYGDVCQAITDLAVERHTPISSADFRTLNRCLDDAIAGAVTHYAQGSLATTAGTFPELRDLVKTAITAFDVLQTGSVGVTGRTGSLVKRSLQTMAAILERQTSESAEAREC